MGAIDALGVGQPASPKEAPQKNKPRPTPKPKPKKKEEPKQGFLGNLVSTGAKVARGANNAVIKPTVNQAERAATMVNETPVGRLFGTPSQSQVIEKVAKKLPKDQADKVRAKGYQDLLNKSGIGIRDSKKTIARKAVSDIGGTVANIVPVGQTFKAAKGAKAVASVVGKSATAGGIATGLAASHDTTNPKEIAKAAGAGAALGGALPIAGAAVGKTVGKVAEKIKPANELEKLATEQAAKQDKNAVGELPKPEEIPEPTPKPEVIPPTKEQIQATQKATAETAKVAEKNTAELKKVDQQLEILDAKKKDMGKISEVDKVKTKQLQERKQELENNNMIQDIKAPNSVKNVPETTSPPLPRQKTADIISTTPNRGEVATPPTGQGASNTLEKKSSEIPTERGSGAITPDNGKFTSRVYQRLKAEHPELKDDLTYEAKNLKKDAETAANLVSKDKNQAYRVAMGVEDHPDATSTAVNIALSEQALAEKNHSLYSQLIKNRSLAQTRRGQELVAEKGSVTDNSTSRYVKELLGTRLQKLGKESITTDLKLLKTPKKRATAYIDQEVTKARSKLRSKELDLQQAQNLIDSLAC